MSVEHGKTPPEALIKQGRPEHGIFLSGALGTYKGIRGIESTMKQTFGSENTTVFNSALSFDTPDPKKFEAIAGAISGTVERGEKAHVVAHSLGVGELTEALRILKKQNPEMYKNFSADNLALTLMSPSGFFRNTRDAFSYIGRTFRFVQKQATMPGINVPANEFRGIDSLSLLPPGEISKDVLAEGIKKAMADKSQHQEGQKEVAFEPDRDYSSELPENVRERVTLLDQTLALAIDQRNSRAIRRLLSSRGALLEPYIGRAFEGELFTKEPEARQLDPASWTVPAALGMIRMIGNVFRGKPMREIGKLHKRGVPVKVMIPEYDMLVTYDQIQRFFGSEDTSDTIVHVRSHAHSSAALQPHAFKQGIEVFRENTNATT